MYKPLSSLMSPIRHLSRPSSTIETTRASNSPTTSKNGVGRIVGSLSVATFAVAACLLTASSAHADNIAPTGFGILGVNNAIDSDLGSPRVKAGSTNAINDGDLNSRVDNWWGNGTTDQGQSVSYAGVVWPSLRYEDFSAIS